MHVYSDGKQIQQYQQNEQHTLMEMQVMAQAHQRGRVKSVDWIPDSLLLTSEPQTDIEI